MITAESSTVSEKKRKSRSVVTVRYRNLPPIAEEFAPPRILLSLSLRGKKKKKKKNINLISRPPPLNLTFRYFYFSILSRFSLFIYLLSPIPIFLFYPLSSLSFVSPFGDPVQSYSIFWIFTPAVLLSLFIPREESSTWNTTESLSSLACLRDIQLLLFSQEITKDYPSSWYGCFSLFLTCGESESQTDSSVLRTTG